LQQLASRYHTKQIDNKVFVDYDLRVKSLTYSFDCEFSFCLPYLAISGQNSS